MDMFESTLSVYDIEDFPSIIFFGANKTNPTEYNFVRFNKNMIFKAAKSEIEAMENYLRQFKQNKYPWRMGEFSFWVIFLIGFACFFIVCLFSGLAVLMRKSTVASVKRMRRI